MLKSLLFFSMQDSDFVDAYLAFSPSGTVSGDFVYVNYALVEDFEYLLEEGGPYETDVAGKICIGRYIQSYS